MISGTGMATSCPFARLDPLRQTVPLDPGPQICATRSAPLDPHDEPGQRKHRQPGGDIEERSGAPALPALADREP